MSRLFFENPETERHRRLKNRLADAIRDGVTEYHLGGKRIDVVGQHVAIEIQRSPDRKKLKKIHRKYKWLIVPREYLVRAQVAALGSSIRVRSQEEIEDLLDDAGW